MVAAAGKWTCVLLLMAAVNNNNFGPLIAYLVPGVTALHGFSRFSSTLQEWFAAGATNAPTLGSFLYLTIASIAAGMTITAIRWAVVDQLHAGTGLVMPPLDFSQLGGKVEAFELLIEIHYRHYQFYANMFIATAIAYACYRIELGGTFALGWPDLGFVLLEAVFFFTSRDTLSKYYGRSHQLLGNSKVPGSVEISPEFNGASVPTDSQSQQEKCLGSDTKFAAE